MRVVVLRNVRADERRVQAFDGILGINVHKRYDPKEGIYYCHLDLCLPGGWHHGVLRRFDPKSRPELAEKAEWLVDAVIEWVSNGSPGTLIVDETTLDFDLVPADDPVNRRVLDAYQAVPVK